ncbi:hypothetical protein [Staphylococcus felis]|nr:hypothetical protein [Staphylococcus felis]
MKNIIRVIEVSQKNIKRIAKETMALWREHEMKKPAHFDARR